MILSSYFPVKDPVLIFTIVAALILLSPVVLRCFRLPGMIGLLLAGALLGPHGFGVLARDSSFVLFGTVGLLYIMFMAAIDIDMVGFRKYRNHSIIFGLTTFALPQSLGTLVAYYLFDFSLISSILLGSLFASHTLIAYPIASRLGIVRTAPVTTAVGGTIITDTLALLVLAVIAESTRGEMGVSFWLRLALSMIIYILVVLLILPMLARQFFRKVTRDGVSEFAFILAVVFGCASLSHLAGLEPIIGAFLAGLALNRLIPQSSTLMNRIQFVGEAVFVPFFLLSVGMLFDVRIFSSGSRAWIIAVGMLLSVVLTKWMAAELMRLFLGYSRDAARVIFGITVAQAAATLAATIIGHDLGLFDDAVVNGSILMILGTCIIAPIVTDRYGRRMAEQNIDDTVAEDVSGRVLVAISSPETVQPLMELAQIIRDPAQGHPVYPTTVVDDDERATDGVAEAEKLLSRAVVQLSAADIEAVPLIRLDINAPSGILRARKENRATEVLVGWAGRTTKTEFFFGTYMEKLLLDPDFTLVVSRITQPLNTSRRILWIVPPQADIQVSFRHTLRLVRRISRQLSARLVVLCTVEARDRVQKRLRRLKPAVSFSIIALGKWSDVTRSMRTELQPGDTLVLCGNRSDAGQNLISFGDFPSRVASRFAENNLLVIYPAESTAESDAPSMRTDIANSADLDGFVIDHIISDLCAGDMKMSVQCLLSYIEEFSGTNPEKDALTDKLAQEALELSPGMVIFHAETPLVEKSSVALGISRTGVAWQGSDNTAFLFVMLLDPPGRDATRHLQNLAAVARLFHSPDTITLLRGATDEKDVLDKLKQISPG